MEVGNVNIQGIIDSLRKGDSRTQVGKVLEQLHKDIEAIIERTDTELKEARVELKRIAGKIGDALRLLKSGGISGDVLGLLDSLKIEPDAPQEVRSVIQKARKAADELRREKIKLVNVNNPGSLNSVV